MSSLAPVKKKKRPFHRVRKPKNPNNAHPNNKRKLSNPGPIGAQKRQKTETGANVIEDGMKDPLIRLRDEDEEDPEVIEAERKKAKQRKRKEDRKEKVLLILWLNFYILVPAPDGDIQQKRFGGWEDIQYSNKERIAAFFALKVAEGLKKTLSAEEMAEIPDLIKGDMFTKAPKNPENEENGYNLDYLPTALQKMVPELTEQDLELPKGTPLVVILARSAERVIAISKGLFSLGTHVHIMTLFARHQKLEEQSKKVQRTAMRIAVTTPSRLNQLVANNSLSLEKTKLVVFDMEQDVKQFHIFDIGDTKTATVEFFWAHLRKKMDEGQLKMTLY